MKKTITAAVLIAALTFAGFQIASAHGGGYYSDNNYGPAYCNSYFNGSSGFTKANRAVFDRETNSSRFGNRFAYGHGPGMMQGYGWNSGMTQGYGPGYGRHMMDW